VIMFVGLQGSGKTTTVTKMAYYYKKKGWKASLICADTFRAGAYDQLKQNATKCKIPFWGSYTETDPVKVAKEGLDYFKSENYEIVIVDTSGRHKQEAELFEEMRQVAQVVNPDNIIFVLDSTIGQAAFDQAQAFKKSVAVGGIVITKMDSHAKGGGALSAVAATQSPVVFIGTGEHMEDFEPFVPKVFVNKLLGMGDIDGLIGKIKDVVPDVEDQTKMLEKIQQGNFTLREMREQFQNILKMGPINKVMEMVPGLSQLIKQTGAQVDSGQKIKNYMTIMDSMTDDELDNNKLLLSAKGKETRITRIARGSGRSAREVNELLEQFKHFEKMMTKMKGLKIPKNGQLQGKNLAQVSNLIPQNLVKQMGGMGAIQNMMRSMGGMNLGSLAKGMGFGGE